MRGQTRRLSDYPDPSTLATRYNKVVAYKPPRDASGRFVRVCSRCLNRSGQTPEASSLICQPCRDYGDHQ